MASSDGGEFDMGFKICVPGKRHLNEFTFHEHLRGLFKTKDRNQKVSHHYSESLGLLTFPLPY